MDTMQTIWGYTLRFLIYLNHQRKQFMIGYRQGRATALAKQADERRGLWEANEERAGIERLLNGEIIVRGLRPPASAPLNRPARAAKLDPNTIPIEQRKNMLPPPVLTVVVDQWGTKVKYNMTSRDAIKRWRAGKPPHWRSAIVKGGGHYYHRSRALRFAVMAGAHDRHN